MTIEEMIEQRDKATDSKIRQFFAVEIAYAEAMRDYPPPKCPTCGYWIAPDGFCTDCLFKGRA